MWILRVYVFYPPPREFFAAFHGRFDGGLAAFLLRAGPFSGQIDSLDGHLSVSSSGKRCQYDDYAEND